MKLEYMKKHIRTAEVEENRKPRAENTRLRAENESLRKAEKSGVRELRKKLEAAESALAEATAKREAAKKSA